MTFDVNLSFDNFENAVLTSISSDDKSIQSTFWSLQEDNSFLLSSGDTSNRFFHDQRVSSTGTTILDIHRLPVHGRVYAIYDRDGGGTRVDLINQFDINNDIILPQYSRLSFYYDPDPNFVGNAGFFQASYREQASPFSNTVVDYEISVTAIIDDAPRDIILSYQPDAIVDGYTLDGGLKIPDGFLGGRYFNNDQIQSPTDVPERWGVVLFGADLDIDQGLGDRLTFTVADSENSAFEVIRVRSDGSLDPEGEFSVLRIKESSMIRYADATPISITIEVEDSIGLNFSKDFQFEVEEFSTLINLINNTNQYAYNHTSHSNDIAVGNDVDNIIYSFAGNDEVYSLGGNDTIYLGTGDDLALSGDGNDQIEGQGGQDSIQGGEGDDQVNGGGGNDSLQGEGGDDFLLGAQNSDHISGGEGMDRLYGGNQGDIIEGDNGKDRLFGQQGQDRLDGGSDNDTMNGGDNADTFVFGLGYQVDTISDFTDNIDQIELDDALWGGTTMTVADIVANYGRIASNGSTGILDFGVDELRLLNFSNLNLLQNDISIV